MRLRYRTSVCALALIAGSAAMQLEPAVVRDLVFDHNGQHIAVGAVRVPLWSAAWAQSPDVFSLENVSFTFGSVSYEAKRIEFSGVTSSRAEIEALFSSASSEPMAIRLARINAKQISVPEARVKQKIGKETQTTTYRNTVLSDIAQGRIASTVIEATAMEATSAGGSTLFSYGRTLLSDLDLPALATLYETKADAASAPLTKIYGAFSIDNIEVVDSSADATIRIARISGRDFMGRPTKDSWTGTMGLFADLADKKKLSSEDEARLIPAFADFANAFEIGFAEATGIEVRENGKQKGKASPVTGRISRVAYTGATGSAPADVRLEELEFSDSENRVKVDALSLKGFSFAPSVDGLKALQGKSFDDIDAATVRTLIPTIGTLRLSGVEIDGLSKDGAEKKPERVDVKIGDFEFTADKPVNGIPTNIRIEQKNASITLPSNSSDDLITELLALGYQTMDGSFVVAANWNEATSEIVLKEISLRWQDMGTLVLTGLLGNVDKDIFNADTAIASVALMGAKAKSLDITVENKGLFERYLAKAAKEQKTSPEALRQTYASAAAVVMPALIGNSEQAQALSQTIARFIAQPGKLTINATPKHASGFGLADALLLSEPREALEKLSITAKAE
jgi:hypothetical protein